MRKRNNVVNWRGVLTERINFVLTLTMVLALLFLSACATPRPIGMAATQVSVPNLRPEDPVFVLRPFVAFEQLHDETPIDSDLYHGSEIEALMISASNRVLRNNKIKTTALGIQKDLLASKFPDEIRKKIPELSKGRTDNESLSLIQPIASHDENMKLLVSSVNAMVGTSSFWWPFSGYIESNNSKSVFHSALFDCASGKLLWKNKVLLRSLPLESRKRLTESLSLLFINFPK